MEENYKALADKYNVPVPRYTSYPTMPYWDGNTFDRPGWEDSVRFSFEESNAGPGISLYIHLPFCESLCTYCGCNTRITKNHGVEEPYIAAVLKEWALYLQLFGDTPVVRELHLGGGTPTFFSPENLRLLITGILKDAHIHPKAEFSFEAHPANTTTDHLQVLYDLGFRRLSLGIQDFDPRVQFVINRHQNVEQVQTVTTQARSIGYTSINYDLIYGLPHQNLGGLINTMNIVAGLKPDRIAYYSYAHVPWIKPGQRRFTEADLPTPEQKGKLQEIGRSLLLNYGYQEIGMDHFALPADELFAAERDGRLHRNFMGYTEQHTQLLVGLGVSSISDSWYAFAQNVKTLEEYLSLVNQGEFPVFKGHVLNNEDLQIRRHILDIMCKQHTGWDPALITGELTEALKRLVPLEADGLVKLSGHSVQVTETGKRFLRNICLCFDARLWADKPATQLFSMAI